MSERGRKIFRYGALLNFAVGLTGALVPHWVAPLIGLGHSWWEPDLEPFAYTFLLRIWSGMAFLWGCMFWEIARDPYAHRAMIKYAWIEKSITAVSVTLAWLATHFGWESIDLFGGRIGIECFLMILVTDYLWIPPFFYYDRVTHGGPPPEAARAEAERQLQVPPAD